MYFLCVRPFRPVMSDLSMSVVIQSCQLQSVLGDAGAMMPATPSGLL